LSFLSVGVLSAIAAFILVQRGIEALKHTTLTPQQTVDTLKENVAWAKDQTT